MAYSLSSFSPKFFYAEGEPYDRSNYAVNSKGQPTSLWSAICMTLDKEKSRIVEILEVPEPTPEYVMECIQKVDLCDDLYSPVGCYIEAGSFYTIEVYDDDH